MEAVEKRVVIVLADISGYTQFLTEAELDHAHGIVTELLNAIIGVVQQYRAENALMALREMAAPTAEAVFHVKGLGPRRRDLYPETTKAGVRGIVALAVRLSGRGQVFGLAVREHGLFIELRSACCHSTGFVVASVVA